MQIESHCQVVHKHTHECTLEYTGVQKQVTEKVRFHLLSFSHKTLVKDSLPTKPLLELIYIQNNMTLAIVFTLNSFVRILTRVAVFTGYKHSTKFPTWHHFEEVKGSDMPLANAQFTCKYVLHSLLEVLNFQCSYHKFVVHNQIHNIKEPSEACPVKYFKWLLKQSKGNGLA